MQMIRCAACGRRYDYRQEGCCPHCGAYNRPPRREWVDADGTVHHGKERTSPVPARYAMRKRPAMKISSAMRSRSASLGRKRLPPLPKAANGW